LVDEVGIVLIIPFLLFPLNWSLEAIKWKYLIFKIERISFFRSLRGVLSGVTLGFVTPMGLGDYVGRILQLNHKERAKSLGAVFVSRFSQFYITLVFGSSALIIVLFKLKDFNLFVTYLTVLLIVLTNILFVVLLVFHQKVIWVFKDLNFINRIYPYIEIIATYSFKELGYVLLLSLFRYLVFTTQFVFMLYFFGVSKDLGILFTGVNFIFLVKSIIPTFFDLGVRESSAVYFFSDFAGMSDKVLFASLSIWIINIIIPAVLGVFLIFRIKIFTKP
jgi:uncharacterized membrane protein YbhN (UPF0104 family)